MRVINVIVVLISFVVGAFIGMRYQSSQQAFKSEEVVGREVVLLEKHKAKPSCEVVMEDKGDWGITSINDGVIVWRYNADQGLLEKVIIDKNLTSAYEERAFNCKKNIANREDVDTRAHLTKACALSLSHRSKLHVWFEFIARTSLHWLFDTGNAFNLSAINS